MPAPTGEAQGLAEPQPHKGGVRQWDRRGHPLGPRLSLSGAPGSAGVSPEEPPAPGGEKEEVCLDQLMFNTLKTLTTSYSCFYPLTPGGPGEAEERQSTCAALERPAEPPDDAHHSWRCSMI